MSKTSTPLVLFGCHPLTAENFTPGCVAETIKPVVGCEECHCARCLRIHHQPHSQRLDSGRAAATEDNNAEAESEADTGPDLGGVGDDENIADQTPQPREPRKETVKAPIRPTSGSRPVSFKPHSQLSIYISNLLGFGSGAPSSLASLVNTRNLSGVLSKSENLPGRCLSLRWPNRLTEITLKHQDRGLRRLLVLIKSLPLPSQAASVRRKPQSLAISSQERTRLIHSTRLLTW